MHHFACENLAIKLFEGSYIFAEFRKKLINLSRTLPIEKPLRWGRAVDSKENENKILGDGFELFAELLVKLLGTHRHIGLSNYVPVNPVERKTK